MNAKLYPSKLSGTTEAQALKSQALRYFTIASVANGKTEIYLKNEAEDLTMLMDAFSDVGVSYFRDKSVYTVTPIENWETFYMRFDVKSSLSALRFILPVITAKCNRIEIMGEGKLARKDVTVGFDLLSTVTFDSKTLPTLVKGQLKSGEYAVTDQTNSQILSALLIALPLLSGDSKIVFVDKPKKAMETALELTVSAMQEFGVKVQKTPFGYTVRGGQEYIAPEKCLVVEGDYSTAGYFLGANLIGNSVEVKNLLDTSLQPERSITKYLNAIKEGQTQIELKGKTSWVFLLTALACKLDRTTIFTGVKLKEKDQEKFQEYLSSLSQLGAEICLKEQTLTVKGNSNLSGGVMLDSLGDSRVAMSFIILASALSSPVTILSIEAGMSEQSSFVNEYIRLGGKCQVI